MLHRLSELDARIRASVQSYDWTGVYPELHNFCATDLSAFYFDVRKDAIYCDRPDSLRRRAARTVLDHLHRCLTTWLAPVLCFTAEEAWCARFGEQDSVHLQLFPDLPAEWRDDALAARWETIRAIRRRITVPIEEARRANTLGSSLQAAVTLALNAESEALLLGGSVGRDRYRFRCNDRDRRERAGRDDQPGAWHQVRALLARAAGGGNADRTPGAVRAVHRRGGVGAGLPSVMLRPPPHPLPQGEGENSHHSPSPCGRGLGGGGRRMTRNRLTLLGLVAAVVVLAADQASKWWILDVVQLPEVGQIVLLPVLNLTMVWNRGVTFGLLTNFGHWSYLLLAAIALAVVAGLVVWLRRAESRLVATALGAIVGGALSNVIDRLRFGAVVDFIHAHLGGWSWYVFNLADAAIVCGVAVLVLDSLLPQTRRARSAG